MRVQSAAAVLILLLAVDVGRPPALNARDDELHATVREGAMFERTAAERLSREFASADISYLLLDVHQDRFVAASANASEERIPVGSLVKPFTALAYAETHHFRFPEQTCLGGKTCWLPRGHGKLGIEKAVSLSCNSYFAGLASKTDVPQIASVARRYGLDGPAANSSAQELAGQYGTWRESRANLVRAYALLLRRRTQPGIREIVSGMRMSAFDGTASTSHPRTLHSDLLAKTGTARCVHEHRAPGDGLVIVAWPVELPRYVLLVHQHGVTGAQTASLAGRMVRSLEIPR